METENAANKILNELKEIPLNNQIKFIQQSLKEVTDNEISREDMATLILSIIDRNFIPRPRTLVMAVHGIRTHGIWQDILESRLSGLQNITIKHISFGYKDVISFILPFLTRRKSIAYVDEQIKFCIQESPLDTRVLIAHSYGTYTVSKFLLRNPDIHIHRIILCGSIVKEMFPWEKMKNRPIAPVVNDCGTTDIWPVLAKACSFGYGDSGTSGFTSCNTLDRYHNFGHCDFFADQFMDEFWVPYITNGHFKQSTWSKERTTKPWLWSLITIFPSTIITIVLIAAILILARIYFLYFTH